MEQDDLKATELDRMTSSHSLQMLKAALPYFPSPGKRLLSVLIKIQELQNTIKLFDSPDSSDCLRTCSLPEDTPKQGFFDMLNEIKEYGSPGQREAFNRANTLIQFASLYEQLDREEAEPDTKNEEALSAASLPEDPPSEDSFRSYLRNSLNEEQKILFDAYSHTFHSLCLSDGKEPENP